MPAERTRAAMRPTTKYLLSWTSWSNSLMMRLARMMSRVLRLGQGSMMENRMLSTRITRLTVSLNMFNLLHELEEERNSFLLVMIRSRWNGRERRRGRG